MIKELRNELSNKKRLILLSCLVLVTLSSRLIPHLPNFTSLTSVALFSGFFFRSRILALLVPLSSLFLSDLFLGWHSQIFSVYSSFTLTVLLGHWFKTTRGEKHLKDLKEMSFLGGVLSSSSIFFIISNFFVWCFDGMYPLNTAGLVQCYIQALPFFRNELMSNFIYSFCLFSAWHIIKKNVPQEWIQIKTAI